jgi:putative transposase
VEVSHETVRQWSRKFGQDYANELRRRRPRPGDKWHLDEMVVRINGVQHYLWHFLQDGRSGWRHRAAAVCGTSTI